MMKRSFKSMIGVTLLEIMLVLAIAAMVIVMSIRYYQTASLNQKINSMMSTVTAITAAGENYYAANGSFAGINQTAIQNYMPGGTMPSTPWGGTITIAAGTDNYSYTITPAGVPANACGAIRGLLQQNVKFVVPADCSVITVTNK